MEEEESVPALAVPNPAEDALEESPLPPLEVDAPSEEVGVERAVELSEVGAVGVEETDAVSEVVTEGVEAEVEAEEEVVEAPPVEGALELELVLGLAKSASSCALVIQVLPPVSSETHSVLVLSWFAKIFAIPFVASANQLPICVLILAKTALTKDSCGEPGIGVTVPATPSRFKFISWMALVNTAVKFA